VHHRNSVAECVPRFRSAPRRGSPEVRAADAQVQDELYDSGEQAAIHQMQQRRMAKSSVTDPFRTFDGAKKGGLGDMFATPDDITFKGSFEEAAKAAETSGKREIDCPPAPAPVTVAQTIAPAR